MGLPGFEREPFVHPLVIETGEPEYPVRIAGTGFVLASNGGVYLVGARHVLNPEAGVSPLQILSPAGQLVPIKDVFFLPHHVSDLDETDVFVAEIDQAASDPTALALDGRAVLTSWEPWASVSPFVVTGFPNQHSWVDYERSEVVQGLVTLVGEYQGQVGLQRIHLLKVFAPPDLLSFSGFSGAPVFLIRRQPGSADRRILCGVAIQGTASSGTIRFASVEVLEDMIRAKNSITAR